MGLSSSALPLIGIALAIANWNARPDAALAWTAAIVMFLVMVAVRWRTQRAFLWSSREAASMRGLAWVTGAVVSGSVMMIIPLAMTLAHAYGVVEDPDGGRAASMIVLGVSLAVAGNTIPRMLPPMSSMQCDGARVQAFQRSAGWIWVLCGLGFATAWLALPAGAAGPVSTALVVASMIVTIVQLLRLRKPREHTLQA